jgi:hypothetical protein
MHLGAQWSAFYTSLCTTCSSPAHSENNSYVIWQQGTSLPLQIFILQNVCHHSLAVTHLWLKIPSFNQWQTCLSQYRTNAQKIGSAVGMAPFVVPHINFFWFLFRFFGSILFHFPISTWGWSEWTTMDLKLVGLEEWCQRETMEIVLYGNSRSLELGLSFPIFHSVLVFLLQSSSPFVSKIYN